MKRNKQKPSISSPEFKGSINLKSYEPREARLVESMIPIWGDIQDINEILKSVDKKDYTAAAIGAGLLLAPNWIEKSIKKAGKALYNGLMKDIMESTHIGNIIRNSAEGQGVMRGVETTIEGFTGSKSLNGMINKGQPRLNPDVADRFKRLGIKLEALKNVSDENLHVYVRENTPGSFQDAKSHLLPRTQNQFPNQVVEDVANEVHRKNPRIDGFNTRAGDMHFINVNLYPYLHNTPELAAHETTHFFQRILNSRFKDHPKIKRRLSELLNMENVDDLLSSSSSGWGGLDELQAELWAFRSKKNIPNGRHLTDSEVNEFIIKDGARMFNSNADPELKRKLVKLLPMIGGVTLISNLNKGEDE